MVVYLRQKRLTLGVYTRLCCKFEDSVAGTSHAKVAFATNARQCQSRHYICWELRDSPGAVVDRGSEIDAYISAHGRAVPSLAQFE